MRPIFFIIIISLFFLTACGTSAPQMTVTSEVTVILTPTPIFTAAPTFTPTPTATPLPKFSPEIITAVETQLPGYTVFGDQIKDGTGNFVPDIHIVPGAEAGTYTTHMAEYIFEANGQIYPMPEHKVELKIDENGRLCQEAMCLENDAWARKMETFPALEGGEVSLEVYSNAEVNAEIVATAKNVIPEERDVTDKGAYVLLDELFGRRLFGGRTAHFTYEGMLMESYMHYAFADNQLNVISETGDEETIETPCYIVGAIGNNGEYALVGWRVGGRDYVRLIDKQGLRDPVKFNSYFEDNEPKW